MRRYLAGGRGCLLLLSGRDPEYSKPEMFAGRLFDWQPLGLPDEVSKPPIHRHDRAERGMSGLARYDPHGGCVRTKDEGTSVVELETCGARRADDFDGLLRVVEDRLQGRRQLL